MSEVAKLYIGDIADLEALENEDVIDFVFAVTNADTTDYDFTGFTALNLFIFDTDTKTKLVETLINSTNLTIPSPTNGEVKLNIDYSADIDIAEGLYYYRLTYEDATSRPITVAKGDFNIIR